jgi:hypothetical protein
LRAYDAMHVKDCWAVEVKRFSPMDPTIPCGHSKMIGKRRSSINKRQGPVVVRCACVHPPLFAWAPAPMIRRPSVVGHGETLIPRVLSPRAQSMIEERGD